MQRYALIPCHYMTPCPFSKFSPLLAFLPHSSRRHRWSLFPLFPHRCSLCSLCSLSVVPSVPSVFCATPYMARSSARRSPLVQPPCPARPRRVLTKRPPRPLDGAVSTENCYTMKNICVCSESGFHPISSMIVFRFCLSISTSIVVCQFCTLIVSSSLS